MVAENEGEGIGACVEDEEGEKREGRRGRKMELAVGNAVGVARHETITSWQRKSRGENSP